ncbi:Gfo/Idh/MocA family oxidoreductase [Companilactobacillus allii]|uniref:NAD(P)-dependent oxidoreductase n=1 Tax=Companilactobacillus allii TaxID=1847728 RepID=A0A1P8Q547_9LACO|nr:Gfo/Idh/MocA family oxidoreductase [Companilactobacillus allii]APX72961.1 NAD(P)-dependent oxidoreductase [Companilactobacillus allii]USQ67753.1 Gfo/Idh/MocA family oxidoreductase [Companilactobacillus allii]
MKLAIIGAGMIVKDYLTMVSDIPEIKLNAIVGVEQDVPTMQELSEKYGIKKVFTNYEECLKQADIDTVYVALPNFLHYAYAKKALESGKNVICEKPFTLKLSEMRELKKLALDKNLILVEAITNQYLTNYKELKESLKKIGDIKLIECNYSQYSHRYDAFKEGKILPVFDPKKGGGALMDINIYNIHFIVGILGKPKSVKYMANIERGIDTSGMLILDYGNTKVVCIGSKDTSAKIQTTIQGNAGSVIVNGPTNVLSDFDINLNNGFSKHVDDKINDHRMYEEFKKFNELVADHDMDFVKKELDHSESVMEIVDMALRDADIQLG